MVSVKHCRTILLLVFSALACIPATKLTAADISKETLQQCIELGNKGQYQEMLSLIKSIDMDNVVPEQLPSIVGLQLWGMSHTGRVEDALDQAIAGILSSANEAERHVYTEFVRTTINDKAYKEQAAKYEPVIADLTHNAPHSQDRTAVSLAVIQYKALQGSQEEAKVYLQNLAEQVGLSPTVEKFLKNNIWDQLRHKSEYQESARWIESVLEAYPTLSKQPDFRVNYGMTLYDANEYDKAILEFQDVVNDPNTPKELLTRGFWGLASAAYELGQFRMSDQYLDEALKYLEFYAGEINFEEQVRIQKELNRAGILGVVSGDILEDPVEKISNNLLTELSSDPFHTSLPTKNKAPESANKEHATRQNNEIRNESAKAFSMLSPYYLLIGLGALFFVAGVSVILARKMRKSQGGTK